MGKRIGVVTLGLIIVTAAVGTVTASALTRGKVVSVKLNEFNVFTAK